MKHKHAELMMQYAQDAMETDKPWERWQYNSNKDDFGFISCDKYTMAFYDDYEYRRKPKMVSVTLMDGEVLSWPEPLKLSDLELNKSYFFIDTELDIHETRWVSFDNMGLVSCGMVHDTKEAAEQHSHALFKINNQVAK